MFAFKIFAIYGDGIYDYITIYGKDFADVIKLKILRLSWVIRGGGVNVITKVHTRERENRVKIKEKKGDVVMNHRVE